MKRTITALVALIAAGGLTVANVASARHDDEPHGYNAKVAAEQQAAAQQPHFVTVGPRAHDQVRRVAKLVPASPRPAAPMAVTKTQ